MVSFSLDHELTSRAFNVSDAITDARKRGTASFCCVQTKGCIALLPQNYNMGKLDEVSAKKPKSSSIARKSVEKVSTRPPSNVRFA